MSQELFSNIPSKVGELLTDVQNGRIGLPDLQRPFVWPDAKVRDLLDSMMKGYPIGYVMLWASPEDYENVTYIGENGKTYKRPSDLVIDGQQRLTALLAAIHGHEIKDKNFAKRKIRISFNPLTREFAVWTPAYEKDPTWISSISDVFVADWGHSISKFRKSYISTCNDGREKNGLEPLTDEDEDLVEQNVKDLLDLYGFPLPTLRINTKANEEDVADIFVRVNSGGQKLSEKNFIETLLAVYDNEVHEKINKFCEESRIPADKTSYNQILKVDPVHLIRVSVGLAFKRARLRYAYMLLRGKDLKTGEISEELRKENLVAFKTALETVTDLNNWHAIMNLFSESGYRTSGFVASSNAVVFCYMLYLIGKYEYRVPSLQLNQIMKKWIFMANITSFYTGSAEADVEKQFADLRDINTPDGFVAYLTRTIEARFTDDYFKVTLPNSLNSSAGISPEWNGYIAAINVLGYPMLFSTTPLGHYLAPGASGTKNAIDKHHIFPKHYLDSIGYTSTRDQNQLANFTYIDYVTNIDISDDPPASYIGRYKQKLGEEGFRLACEQNALPGGFEQMEYQEFLEKRRILMAEIIRKAYQKLC